MLDHVPNCCPDCGAGIENQRKWNQHTNGHWNESATYACKKTLAFSPNFMKVEEVSPCTKHPKFTEAMQKREILMLNLQKTISNSDADEDFKKRVRQNNSHISVRA